MRALRLTLAILLASMSTLRAFQIPAFTQRLPSAINAFVRPHSGAWAVRARGLCSARPEVLQAARGGDGAAELSDAALQKVTVQLPLIPAGERVLY